ncbi:MAG: DUF1934 domain-containing protein [Oscillospiraceae bacterium]
MNKPINIGVRKGARIIMDDNCLITINGTMEQHGESDSIELKTRGSFTKKNNAFFISYKESEATGYKGCMTTVKVEDTGTCVSMLRFGSAPSQLVIEKGTRHVCHYETGHGALSLGVSADEIENGLSETGGTVKFSYMLDFDTTSISRNTVNITVKPLN